MARIPETEINRIKEEISIVRLVESKGIELKKHGKDYIGRCPFHDDKTPSLVISPDKNLWHCMGACQTGGDVINWIMRFDGVSFRHAVELLRCEELPTTVNTKPVKKCTTPKLPPLVADNQEDQEVLNRVVDYYHKTLKQNEDALAYLKKRGLDHPDVINHFKLGVVDRSLPFRLPKGNRGNGARIREQLQRLGILKESGHEHFRGSLIIPVIDQFNNCLEVYGRKLQHRLRKGTPKHLYLPGAHNGVWNIAEFKNHEEIIICEALIDALTFWVNGFKNVTSSYGIEGFTSSHLAAFKEHNIKKVFIAYDRDEAGNNAADKLASTLIAEGIDCFRINFPKGMDANQYALKVQPADKSLDLAIRKAIMIGNGKAVQNQPCENIPVQKQTEKLIPSLAAKEIESVTDSMPVTGSMSVTDHEVKMIFGDRNYRVRGLQKNMSYEQLKINILISCKELFHVDTFDIYSARHRATYIKQAFIELGIGEDIIKKDIGKVLLKLEELQDKQIQDALEVKIEAPQLSAVEEMEAVALLESEDLILKILDDFNRAGVVGEETNKLVGYLAGVSRKLDKPLAILIQSSSAAGKTSLMDACLSFMPTDETIQYSAMTGQSLFYMGETNLKNKILAIAEEEGAENTSYALKLLQSEGEVTMASTGKNAVTGNLETQEYRVEGPVALFSTTTAIDIDEELLNRCIVLTVDESREQTEAIHVAQRKKRTLEGLHAKINQEAAKKLHANAQRLLKPLMIINPYADDLTYLSDKTRTRRDHEKYLGLIDAITLLHQYQRQIKCIKYNGETVEYIEVALDDIELANKLAHEVLGRSLDELPPQTRKLLAHINEMVEKQCCRLTIEKSDYRFSRREVRDYSGWTDFQMKKHMRRLEEMEYVLVHSGSRGKSIVYELLYNNEGKHGNQFIMGLIDIEKLKYDSQKEPLKQEKKPSSSPQIAPKLPPSSTSKNPTNPVMPTHSAEGLQNLTKCTYSLEKTESPYLHKSAQVI